MFTGFKSKEELRDAIHAANPEMTDEESERVDQDLSLLYSVFSQSEDSSGNIMAGMIEVVDVQEYAFMRERGWKIRKPKQILYDTESS